MDSTVVIRPTPEPKPPCVMSTGVWNGQRPKFQSPRHSKVFPNQNTSYTTESTTHDGPAKGNSVSGVCPSDITDTHHFCFHTRVPRLLGSQEVRGGNQCAYPLGTTGHVCLNRGTPHETLDLNILFSGNKNTNTWIHLLNPKTNLSRAFWVKHWTKACHITN